MQPKTVFLELKEATFYNSQSLLFDKISWKISHDEHWAITGPVGAGKTSLIEALLGKHILRQGEIVYPFLEKYNQKPEQYTYIQDVVAILSFQEDSYLFNYANFYYQQRFHAADSEGIITAGEYLSRSTYGVHPSAQHVERISALLGIEALLPLEFIKLSNGQTRKVRIAKVLLKNPELLILDNPFTGLDTNARQDLHQLVNELILQGTKIIITTHHTEIPENITHVLVLENFHIKGMYQRKDFVQQASAPAVFQQNGTTFIPFIREKLEPHFHIAVSFENVNVQYGEKKALQDINWTVHKGEKWALSGPNGSGKSTMLSLINADHPQAYANKITLFDKKRGTGESIWDIKKRIGFISPELHLYFRKNMTCQEVAATGLFDTLVLNRPIAPEDEKLIKSLFEFYQLKYLLDKSFLRISSGQQRVVLLIRSLIKNPDLIIWDEPFQGLDEKLTGQSTQLLQQYCTGSNTLIFVTHYPHEIPAFVDKFLFLENGKINKIETKNENL